MRRNVKQRTQNLDNTKYDSCHSGDDRASLRYGVSRCIGIIVTTGTIKVARY